MMFYTTRKFTNIGCYEVWTPGPDIWATNKKHAKIALTSMGKGHYVVHQEFNLEVNDARMCGKVVWDSLLDVNKIQSN